MCKQIIIFFSLAVLIISGCEGAIDAPPVNEGSIYGVVAGENAELLRGADVSLFTWENISARIGKSLIMQTVTYDDGHFEFIDIDSGTYTIAVSSEGYEGIEMDITVLQGKTSKIDLKMKPIEIGLVIITYAPTIMGTNVKFKGHCSQIERGCTEWGFVYGEKAMPTINNHIVKTNEKELDSYSSISLFSFGAELNIKTKGIYHVRAYGKNPKGVAYGEDRQFEIR